MRSASSIYRQKRKKRYARAPLNEYATLTRVLSRITPKASSLEKFARGSLRRRLPKASLSLLIRRGQTTQSTLERRLLPQILTRRKRLLDIYETRFLVRNDSGILIEDIAETIMKRCSSSLLITRGAEGMSLFERGAAPVTITARARQVYDVTGAGDTVVATLALGLAAGLSLENACRLGNLAAGLVVAKLGASTISLHALEIASTEEDLIRH